MSDGEELVEYLFTFIFESGVGSGDEVWYDAVCTVNDGYGLSISDIIGLR